LKIEYQRFKAYFYDSKGNDIGSYKGTVNPTILKGLQLGAYNMRVSTSVMKGTPSFLPLPLDTHY
jgi:hypothetical protein